MKSEETELRLISMTEAINNAWLKGKPAELAEYFHPGFVIQTHDFKILTSDRDTAIKSYADFITHCRVSSFMPSDYKVSVFGNTALCSYSYDISWNDKNGSFMDTGKEMFLFSRNEERWLAVLRQV